MALQQTGYQASAASIVWTSGQDLNSLTDNEFTDLSDAIDNSSNKYVEVDLRLDLASAAFTGTDSRIAVYLIPTVDGTNYPNWVGDVATDQQQNEQYWVGNGTTSGATEAQEIVVRNISLPPGLYRWGFRNLSGVTTAGSGNDGQWRPHSFEDV